MARKTIKVRLVDEQGYSGFVDMTIAEYHYMKWHKKHEILAALLGMLTFGRLYWIYFKIRYRK